MKISKQLFCQAMNLIRAEQIKFEQWYDKLESCIGCIDTIIEKASIDPMISMLETICGDTNKLISLYIYDTKWGSEPCCLEDQNGNKLPFRTLEDLYNALKLPCSRRLELSLNDRSK